MLDDNSRMLTRRKRKTSSNYHPYQSILCLVLFTAVVTRYVTTLYDLHAVITQRTVTKVTNTPAISLDGERGTANTPQAGKPMIKEALLAQPEEVAFSLALDRFWRRIKAEGSSYYPDLKTQYQTTNKAITKKTKLLNSIRIPKSGSSVLSVKARALAGCSPDGYPCCAFPGSPKGSCPRKDLMCSLITGCTDHRPNYNGEEVTITSLRNPVSRSVSAFFYSPPHTSVKQGKPHNWDNFVANIETLRYRNVLTKMLNGAYAYDDFNESKHTISSAKARLCSMAWFGLSDMPISSSIMMYETPDFIKLLPNRVAFGLLTQEKEKETSGLRVNNSSEYKNFLATSFANNGGASFIIKHNQNDIEVFRFAEKLFCGRLLSKVKLVGEMSDAGIGIKEIQQCTNLGNFSNLEQLC